MFRLKAQGRRVKNHREGAEGDLVVECLSSVCETLHFIFNTRREGGRERARKGGREAEKKERRAGKQSKSQASL